MVLEALAGRNAEQGDVMAQGQGVGFGKVVLYIVLGVLAVVIGVQVIQWFFGILGWILIIGGVAAVGYLLFRAGQRSVGGNNRRQLPR
jgi:pheromone shutdown protein TraB